MGVPGPTRVSRSCCAWVIMRTSPRVVVASGRRRPGRAETHLTRVEPPPRVFRIEGERHEVIQQRPRLADPEGLALVDDEPTPEQAIDDLAEVLVDRSA